MKEKVIYRDEQEIKRVKSAHVKYVDVINTAIDAITATGVEMTGEMMSDIFTNDEYILKEADRQIRAEQDRLSRFKYFSRRVDTTPVTDEIRDALAAMNRQLYATNACFTRSYIVFVDGRAMLIDDIDTVLEDMYSIKLDTKSKAEAWELAIKAKDAINELEKYLHEHSNGCIHSCGRYAGSLATDSLVVLKGGSYGEEYHAETYPHIIHNVTN